MAAVVLAGIFGPGLISAEKPSVASSVADIPSEQPLEAEEEFGPSEPGVPVEGAQEPIAKPIHIDTEPAINAKEPPQESADRDRLPAATTFAMDKAIEKATQRALESGSSEKWSADGKRGFVVVSAVQAYQDRTCRNVITTVIVGQKQDQAPTKTWCKAATDGVWQSE